MEWFALGAVIRSAFPFLVPRMFVHSVGYGSDSNLSDPAFLRGWVSNLVDHVGLEKWWRGAFGDRQGSAEVFERVVVDRDGYLRLDLVANGGSDVPEKGSGGTFGLFITVAVEIWYGSGQVEGGVVVLQGPWAERDDRWAVLWTKGMSRGGSLNEEGWVEPLEGGDDVLHRVVSSREESSEGAESFFGVLRSTA